MNQKCISLSVPIRLEGSWFHIYICICACVCVLYACLLIANLLRSFITSQQSESSFLYHRNYTSLNYEPKDACISKLKFIEFLTIRSRTNLAGVKYFWTAKISNIFSINWLLWSLYLQNYQNEKYETKAKSTTKSWAK